MNQPGFIYSVAALICLVVMAIIVGRAMRQP